MRHRHRKAKLGRTTEHRTALLSNLVCSLIKHRRIETTLAKAKAARVVADKMVTLSKKGQTEEGSLQYRRLVGARLQRGPRRFFSKVPLGQFFSKVPFGHAQGPPVFLFKGPAAGQ